MSTAQFDSQVHQHTSPPTSLAALFTKRKSIQLRLKDEIKFLYVRKTELNKQLYRMHLTVASEWDKGAQLLLTSIHDTLTVELQHKYKTLGKKLEKLKTTQTHNNSNYPPQKFYPRVISNTNIDFTPHELPLLNKGLKYNLHYKQKQWVKTLALEAETAIGQLPLPEQEPIRYQVNRNIEHLFNTVGKQQYKNSRERNEKRVLRSIKEKLTENDATIFKADKGISIIVTL
jgi:hypothetical protein